MKLLQKSTTRQELLDNTIKFYNLNNRCVTGLGCRYRYNNKACAIGREISDELANRLDNEFISAQCSNNDVFKLLPIRLQKMGSNFLNDIQILHDNAYNWTKKGLSENGKSVVKGICYEYNLNYNL